jgi:hypothetical protein
MVAPVRYVSPVAVTQTTFQTLIRINICVLNCGMEKLRDSPSYKIVT